MADFQKINEMIDLIEANKLPEGMTFNEFSLAFYEEVRLLPLSKYLRSVGKDKRLPKVMNMRKAGEVLKETFGDADILSFVKRKSKTNQVPELDYRSIMLLRRIDLRENWEKIFRFFRGSETVAEINATTRPDLLPQEIELLEEFIQRELQLKEDEFEWFLQKFRTVLQDKALMRALRKLTK